MRRVTRGGRRTRARGFTLVEVAVTLGIIALVAAVAVPAMLPGPARGDLDVAVDEVRRVLQSARDEAVRQATSVRVAVDSISGAVWVISGERGSTRVGAGAAGGAGVGPGFGAVTAVPLALPAGVRMATSAARAEFVFHPEGSAYPDSVFLSGVGGVVLVTVDAMNGHVLVAR